MEYSAIVVDDESLARRLLKGMVETYLPKVKVLDECADLPEAVKSIRKWKPDLVFLDIEMPGHSGLEILDFFEKEECQFHIVFTTAYNQYAVQAFKLSAVDYLLKPIEPEALMASFDLFVNRQNRSMPDYDWLKANLSRDGLKNLAVHTPTSVIFIQLSELLYLKADGAYTHLVTDGKPEMLSSKNLKHYEDILCNKPGSDFFRLHKSYIINLRKVKEYVRSDGGYVVLHGNHHIPVSNEKKEEFLKLMYA